MTETPLIPLVDRIRTMTPADQHPPQPLLTGRLSEEQGGLWNSYVRRHPSGTVFHGLGWRDAVLHAFPHRPEYWGAWRGDQLVGVLPSFVVRSRLAGRLLVSVPYGVGGGILADDREAASTLLSSARRAADDHRCRYIDLRSEEAYFPELSTVDEYVGFRRVLPEVGSKINRARTGVDDPGWSANETDSPGLGSLPMTDPEAAAAVLDWLPRKARAAARNGQDKHGLTIEFGSHLLGDVWRLYGRGMRRLGSIAYPLKFLRALVQAAPGACWLCVVRKDREPVAGLLTLLDGDRVMPYFVGIHERGLSCCAANYLYWQVMVRAVSHGFREFDFGRSRRSNTGSVDFKRFHGFAAQPLGYQFACPADGSRPRLSPGDSRFALVRRAWRHLPLWCTRAVGGYVARHVPG